MHDTFQIERVRTRLLLDQPFFGTLAMHVDLIEDASIPTAQTNGVFLKYNPDFFATLTTSEQVGVLAHEVLHCALLHPYRRGSRDAHEWNVACDYAINSQLLASNFVLPSGVLVDPQYDGMSAEQIYSKRRAEPMQEPEPSEEQEEQDEEGPDQDEEGPDQDDSEAGDDGQGDEDGADDDSASDDSGTSDESGEGDEEAQTGAETSMPGCPTGEFVDGPETASAPEELTAADWEVIAEEAAAVATRAGDLPGGIGRALKETREPSIDWKADTQAFIVNTVESDLSWSRPNRRFVSRGLYLPGPVKENVGVLVVGLDTSSSITQAMLNDFASELVGLMRDARPEKVHVVYCDTQVNGVQEFETDDEIKLTLTGGGGTDFQPVFDWVEENGIDPIGLVYLTDLEASAPSEPSYPVLWVTPLHTTYPAPFGQVTRMSA
jgi:predicted metal-dependent peptidase